MNATGRSLSGVERTFGVDEIIVSKTDLSGVITYANHVFCRVAGYSERELLGAPHSIVRHPDMPRSVFKLLWDTIQDGREVFAYVVNRAKNGDHYWVFAHVTPTFSNSGKIIGYHSNRRLPDRSAIELIGPLYATIAAEEQRHSEKPVACKAGLELFHQLLASRKISYRIWSFQLRRTLRDYAEFSANYQYQGWRSQYSVRIRTVHQICHGAIQRSGKREFGTTS